MSKMIYLTRDDVRSLLPAWMDQIDLVERIYRDYAAGSIEMPPKPGIHSREGSFIHAMPAYLRDSDVAAIKWVGGYPTNRARGLSYISGLIILNDAETGFPIAVMDCIEITAARTAAASGVAIRRWAPAGWSTVAVIGCGEQGRFHADMVHALNPQARIIAYDPDRSRAESLPHVHDVVESVTAACEGADVVITLGPIVNDREPSVHVPMLKEPRLVLPVDLDMLVSADVVHAADLFLTDSVPQFEYFSSIGYFDGWPAPQANVGDRVHQPGEAQRAVICNIGLGALDAAFADVVYKGATAAGVGIELPY